jgi:hypothetical protein
MSSPAKLNFKIYQGSTFQEVLRWESGTKQYFPITAITKSAPITITAPGNEMLVGWRFKVTNVVGMTEISSPDIYHISSGSAGSLITINAVNSLSYKDYASGGVIEYNKPVSLIGVTARMQIRAKIGDPTVLYELTTENGGIIINTVTSTITINIPPSVTAGFTFATGVYSLEVVNSNIVSTLIVGNISVIAEVTR